MGVSKYVIIMYVCTYIYTVLVCNHKPTHNLKLQIKFRWQCISITYIHTSIYIYM